MRVKTDAKRQTILEAAAEVFRVQGFAGASMTAVAERAGGSKATLYRYFDSKEDVFIAVMLDAVIENANERSSTHSGPLTTFAARWSALAPASWP